MKKILYIGNFLSKNAGKYEGPNLQVVKFLRLHGFHVRAVSSQSSIIFRFFNFLLSTISARILKFNLIIIDVFSTNAFYFAFAVGFLARLLKLNYVLVLHGGNLPYRFKTNPRLSSFLVLGSSFVVSPSQYLANSCFTIFNRKVFVIPNFLEIFHSADKKRDPFLIYWVRSIRPVYNIDMALRVMVLLKSVDSRFFLRIVGPSSSHELAILTTKIHDLKLENNVSVLGKQSRSLWHTCAKEATFFINTTTVDNTPSSVLEAMALGLIVVSTNVGGIPYIIKNSYNGFTVSNDDSEAMAAQIIRIYLDSELLDNIRENAKDYVSTEFDKAMIEKSWVDLVSSIS